ncbi:hypothetical protein ACFYNA_15390 [Streptomyces sp. NPDC006640]|uniref:hypothetical protein n=1 Tax=Streptomyces sp. NPDC006640 TaxID=3364754 RepID=UPI00368A6819
MGLFSRKTPASSFDGEITTAEDLPRFEAVDTRASRRQTDWDAQALEYRAKCPQDDHTRCLSH